VSKSKFTKPSQRVVNQQNRIIGELTLELENTKDSLYRHREWTREAKRAAGVHDMVSFDIVWAKALELFLKEKKAGNLEGLCAWRES
jgi:hypothetical protein